MDIPSAKIDELARRVLKAAKWPGMSSSSPPPSGDAPTPHMDELERALDVRLPPLASLGGEGGDGAVGGGSSGMRTCTVPNNGGSESAADDDYDGVWTWTPRTNTTNNSYSKTPADDDGGGRTLEEMAPFPPDFYRALGELVREAFHPGSVRHLERDRDDSNCSDAAARSEGAAQHCRGVVRSTATTFEALRSLERYSLPRMMDAARMTRILLSLQELNMGDGSFVERLLHYCEGMSIRMDQNEPEKDRITAMDKLGNNAAALGRRIPVLSALFRHWGSLPELEHHLQRLARRYGALLPSNAGEYREYLDSCTRGAGTSGGRGPAAGGSVGDKGSTGGEWRPSSSSAATSFLGDRALRIESLKVRLEEELNDHINGGCGDTIKLSRATAEQGGLVELLTVFYRSSDAALRGKCRRWMGQWLRSHALGGGSSSVSRSTTRGVGGGDSAGRGNAPVGDDVLGPSFASFCPLVAATSPAAMNASTGVSGEGMATMAVTGPISITHVGGGGGVANNPLGIENTSACGVEALLRVLLRIVLGFRPLPSSRNSENGTGRSGILRPSHEHLLFDVIVPLHRPSGMVLWRDQTPLIGLYHEALVKTIGAFLSIDRSLVGPIVGALLHPDIWPSAEGGNTPKVVLLLHEVDTLIGLLLQSKDSGDENGALLASFDAFLLPLVARLCLCISSENSRTSERALQFFQNKAFKNLVQRRLPEVGYLFLRALCRCPSRELPWNPTVRKMTLLVLQDIEGYYKQQSSGSDGQGLFGRACEEAFSGVDLSNGGPASEKAIKSPKGGTAKVDTQSGDSVTLSGDMTSLRGAMGLWKPPPQKKGVLPRSSKGKTTRQPPSTVTGVAPWAVGGQNSGRKLNARASGQKPPPLTVTGVAPWAVKKKSHGLPSSLSNRKASISNALPRPLKKHVSGPTGIPLPHAPSGSLEVGIEETDIKSGVHYQTHVEEARTALGEVRSYMEKLKPKGDAGKSGGGVSSWAKAQMEASPVLFPSLKFHDLVFGHDLGTGAFSTVKYARRIDKTCTRSNWPEYAVKIVSTQKIEELGYEQSINREIAILRTLSHPGISRLVSSFRFRDGAYLILEYASGGDLHSLLRKNGSLDHDSTRFVIGSVAAALYSLHERGFVYADCKPENILITETGHIKVTDFGGCRPVTQDAKALVKESSSNLVKQLRDGDWKKSATTLPSSSKTSTEKCDDDLRIEGTTAYLPPEVVIGGFPTTAADIWALGCVLFQCISGRPPILEDTDDLTAQKIVSFDLNSDKQNFFGECGATFRVDAKTLIERMLHRDVACRPDILQIADSDFFNGMDIFSLHRKPAYPLDVGSIAPKSDAKWSRRQFSSIWAPQPRAYNIGATPDHPLKAGHSRSSPIREGDEADEEFLPRQKAPLLTRIRE